MAVGDLFNFCHLNLSIVFTVITSIVILTCSCMVYIFTKNYQKSKEKIKSIRITIGIFTVSTFIALIMSISIVIRCLFSDTLLISAFAYLWIGMYCTQLYCLSLIFFLRIYHIFKTSIYKLSNKTFKCYISMFILLAILFFCAFILWNNTDRIVTEIMFGLLIFNIGFLNVSLLILFVYKLLLVYRNTNSFYKGMNSENIVKIMDLKSYPIYKVDSKGYLESDYGLFINKKYVLIGELGRGAYSKVFESINVFTKTRCAIKIIRNIEPFISASKSEFEILKDVENNNLCIHLQQHFVWKKHCCLVFPMYGPSILDIIKQNKYKPFPNYIVRSLTFQICKA
eukprot:50954_1